MSYLCEEQNLQKKGEDDMRRKAIEQLRKWKESADRKPLIVQGARQVGKTWLMQEFAK